MKKKKADEVPIYQSLVDIATESFRFRRTFSRAISSMDLSGQERYANQFTYFIKKVESALNNAGLRIINIEGQLYDIGMAVSPLNIDDFKPDEPLYIEQMVEPIIMKDKSVIKTGTVILGRANP